MAKGFFWFLLAAVALMVMAGLAGCSSRTVYVPVESVRVLHDSVRVSSALRDRVMERDTVRERVSGDTVYMEVTRWRWRDREMHDTVWHTNTDTLHKNRVELIEKTMEHTPTLWEKIRLGLFWPLVLIIAVTFVIRLLRRRDP